MNIDKAIDGLLIGAMIGLLGSIATTIGLPAQAKAQDASSAQAPGRYIVVLKPGFAPETVSSDHKVQPDAVYRFALNGFAGPGTAAQAQDLKNDPRVKSIENDQVVHVSGALNQETGHLLHAPVFPSFPLDKQVLPIGVDRIDADLSSTALIDGTDERVDAAVAIIDSGIDLHHPDLNVVNDVSFVPGKTRGDDDLGHGTGCAGIVGALDNDFGVVGVAPGARLWAVKVTNAGWMSQVSWVLSGIDYVTQHAQEIDVVNMSLFVQNAVNPSPAVDEALTNSIKAGVTYVAAAGNRSTDVGLLGFLPPQSNPDVILVSAINDTDGKGGALGSPNLFGNDDTFAAYSNFGPLVDIAAPGGPYLTTYPGGLYNIFGLTSGATAHVAGAVALYKAKHPGATPAQVQAALLQAAKPQTDPMFGFTGDPDSSPEPLVYAARF